MDSGIKPFPRHEHKITQFMHQVWFLFHDFLAFSMINKLSQHCHTNTFVIWCIVGILLVFDMTNTQGEILLINYFSNNVNFKQLWPAIFLFLLSNSCLCLATFMSTGFTQLKSDTNQFILKLSHFQKHVHCFVCDSNALITLWLSIVQIDIRNLVFGAVVIPQLWREGTRFTFGNYSKQILT